MFRFSGAECTCGAHVLGPKYGPNVAGPTPNMAEPQPMGNSATAAPTFQKEYCATWHMFVGRFHRCSRDI